MSSIWEFLNSFLSWFLVIVGIVIAFWPVIQHVLGKKFKALKGTKSRRAKLVSSTIGIFIALAAGGQLVTGNKLQAQKDAAFSKLEKDAKTTLSFHSKEIKQTDDGYWVRVIFEPSNNKSLGLLSFEAKIINDSNAKILKFAPMGSGLAESYKKILDDGKTAQLVYSFLGIYRPEVGLILSGKTHVRISGSHELEPFEIKVE